MATNRIPADDYLDFRGCRKSGTLRSPLVEWAERRGEVVAEKGLVTLVGRILHFYQEWLADTARLNALLPPAP